MKFYETHTEEYISSVERYNIHPELKPLYDNHFPKTIDRFDNMIIYGPSGAGKYSQVLYFLKEYSPSHLKYEKKMTIQNEKQTYIYHISDIHYEIDMSFLGCNSKILWHDIFLQIVDIISVKQNKIGIIVCKNFHMIHSELLEIFYSYIQQYNNNYQHIKIKFIIITEHISFLPTNILNICCILPIKRPNQKTLENIISSQRTYPTIQKITKQVEIAQFQKKITNTSSISIDSLRQTKKVLYEIGQNSLLNLKEIRSFDLIKESEEIPTDIFNIICDEIIETMEKKHSLQFTNFRDLLYNILIYNLDVIECIWYILIHFINTDKLNGEDISNIMEKTHLFLKYFNNNYRPIYHLESIMFYIISKIHNYDNKRTCIKSSRNK
jgi:hypothetical protein